MKGDESVLGFIMRSYVSDAHAQSVVSNVIIIPPRKF
jgi:hypothetical protein